MIVLKYKFNVLILYLSISISWYFIFLQHCNSEKKILFFLLIYIYLTALIMNYFTNEQFTHKTYHKLTKYDAAY